MRKTKADVQAQMQAAIEEAKKCLTLPEFEKYKKRYEKARETVIHNLIEYRNPDPIQYAFYVSNMLNSLRSLGTLLFEVKKEARDK